MNEIFTKAYDLIKEEQRNADNKAYIFIGLLTAVVGLFSKIPTNGYSSTELSGLSTFMFILLFPLLILVLSLIPNYRVKLFLGKKVNDYKELNIFYWRNIIHSDSKEKLVAQIFGKYNLKVDNLNLDLIDQILINARIMSTKATLHEIAFKTLIHILFFLFASAVTVVFSNSNIIIFLVTIVTIEILYFCVPLIKNKNQKENKEISIKQL